MWMSFKVVNLTAISPAQQIKEILTITAICFEQMVKFSVFRNSPEFGIIIYALVPHWGLQLNCKQNKRKINKLVIWTCAGALWLFTTTDTDLEEKKTNMHIQCVIWPFTSTNCGCAAVARSMCGQWALSTEALFRLSDWWLLLGYGDPPPSLPNSTPSEKLFSRQPLWYWSKRVWNEAKWTAPQLIA